MNTACLTPRCPRYAVPGGRGRCADHRETTSQRGYGRAHQAERQAALPGARCAACGCVRNLQRDHVMPISLGGTQAPENKRWLCGCSEHGCHARVGIRSNSRVVA